MAHHEQSRPRQHRRRLISRAGLGTPVRQEVDGREYWEVGKQIVTEHGVYEGVLATLRLGDVIVSVGAPDSAAVRRAVSALQRVN